MSLSFSVLALTGTFALSLFLGVLNFWFWRAQRDDPTPLWMGAWLGTSALFTLFRLFQYAPLSETAHILIPRILLSVAYPLAWLGYELGNSFIGYRPSRWERALLILFVALPVMLLWTGNLLLTDQIVIRLNPSGGDFTGVQTGILYLPVSLLILVVAVVPVVRLARTSYPHQRENRFMAFGLSFVILFSLSDFLVTALGLAWIRFTDFSYLTVAIFFSYIQVRRFGRLYREMDVLVRERTAELVQAYDSTLEGWANALELRDKETEGHSRRVTELTLKLAGQMDIPEHNLKDIYRGVLLHDIGKMGIPDIILNKPGPLNDEEWEEMRKHPRYAYDLIYPIAFLRPALDIPYHHHEKWDGSGYPDGLKGENIPLAARIFAVVDVWDALMSDRPYRKAWPREKVLEYIREQSGIHFDPQVVDAFFQTLSHETK